MKKLAAITVVLGAVMALFMAGPAAATGKVTLCHLADGPAQAGLITVAKAAAYHGHYLQHSADIIPPFHYQGVEYSLNWTGSFPEECTGDTPPPDDPPDDPVLVEVCDPETGDIIEVPEDEADQYLPVDDPACDGDDPPPPCAGGNCTPDPPCVGGNCTPDPPPDKPVCTAATCGELPHTGFDTKKLALGLGGLAALMLASGGALFFRGRNQV